LEDIGDKNVNSPDAYVELRFHRRFSASSSSNVRGQSAPSSLDKARSASTLPPVWHLAQ
jgi:hypothetical protein